MRTIGMGPFDYQQRVRATIVKFVGSGGKNQAAGADRAALAGERDRAGFGLQTPARSHLEACSLKPAACQARGL